MNFFSDGYRAAASGAACRAEPSLSPRVPPLPTGGTRTPGAEAFTAQAGTQSPLAKPRQIDPKKGLVPRRTTQPSLAGQDEPSLTEPA